MTNQTTGTTAKDLVRSLQKADARVLLVSPRVMQRIVRFDRRLSTLDLTVPHTDCYFISRDRLFDFTMRYEYQLQLDRDLPETLILLPLPEDDELERIPAGQLLRTYWRRLFHIRVHLAYRDLFGRHELSPDRVLDRLGVLGPIPFAECRVVLHAEEKLLPPLNYNTVYTELAASFLELWHFAPHELPEFFPAIRDHNQVASMLSDDFDHAALREETRLAGALPPKLSSATVGESARPSIGSQTAVTELPERTNPITFRRLLARAERLEKVGHHAKAAILLQKASRIAPIANQAQTAALASESIARFAARLSEVLDVQGGNAEALADALKPLLAQADRGFRSTASRLLYDLQKVCTEQQRGVYTIDLFRWIATRGKSPLRRPLPLLRAVLVIRHLKSALQKLQLVRIAADEHQRFERILAESVDRARQSLRDRVRPLIQQVFEVEGCRPQNVVEITAFNKIIEELLDRVADYGHLSMGHLRDSISQSNIKLPDLVQVQELLTGDQLLRIDRRLATVLDGVYHRGPIYLRMSHRLSSMAFGTPFGRVLTRYVALPFGGAYLILESFRHLVHFLIPQSGYEKAAAAALATESLLPEATNAHPAGEQTATNLVTISFVLVCGIFIMLLIENAAFRTWCLRGLRRLGHLLLYLVRDVPELLFRLTWVRQILESPWYVAFVNYAFKPVLISAGILLLVDRIWHWLPDRQIVTSAQLESVTNPLPYIPLQVWWVIVFLACNLFLNSPIGRYTDALVMDNLRRGWRELRMRVFAAAIRFVIDSFQWMLKALEQVIYTVDELLRFRSGEFWLAVLVKAIAGAVWAVISYVVRIYITLLIEPQINPIKHFPVVTVSHKMILPFSLSLTRLLATPLEQVGLGGFLANTIAGTTVFLLPGVFGFLAWELKENWRLYAANRGNYLGSISIGSHGETMVRLLRPGFHSGTVPKLYGKLRRAWHKAEGTGNESGVRKIRDRLQHVEHAIKVFIEREWIALLRELPEWKGMTLRVDSIRLSTNEIEVEVVCDEARSEPLRLIFSDLGGWLIARVGALGWAEGLSATQSQCMKDVFKGVYRYCGIDLVWQDFIPGLGLPNEPVWYDFNRDGVLIWNSHKFDSNVQYKLRDLGATAALTPPPKFVTEPRQEDLVSIIFANSPISWDSWVQLWEQRRLAASVESVSRSAG